MKSATLFSGFDGVGIGMQAAGLSHVWGVEYDDQIASVARLNGFNTHTLNILDADPALFEPVDVLHASPPCPNFSVAKTGAEETPHDIALARKVADFIEVIRPKYFTLENVYAYRNSQSWQIISNRLYACGYWCDMQHVNFADMGVPQTRQRMIVRAVLGGFVPYLPKAETWQGWYQAIEDLIPTLPPSEFAPWQLARLPEGIQETILVSNQNDAPTGVENRAPRYYNHSEPCGPILATTNLRWRAFISDSHIYHTRDANRFDNQPSMEISEYSPLYPQPRAFIVNTNQSGDNGERIQIAYEHQPSFTVKISDIGRSRAFIVDDQNGSFNDDGSRGLIIRDNQEPMFTVTASQNKRQIRAWLQHGRVVKMTPRALARFQSFPDWYKLPEKPALACKGIGNAVPPKGMEKIYRALFG